MITSHVWDRAGQGIAAVAASDVTTEDLLAALPERIGPVRRSGAFWLRLVLAAAILFLVLSVYVALVVVTSYGVWSHLASPRLVAAVRAVFGEEVLYNLFCVMGPILCVFLVKPIFTMQSGTRMGVKLDRSVEPRLFAFVERLCSAQGAPAPRQIRVDTDVNASASLRHGLFSLFRDDLELTIGLPLVRAMTLRELTGVMSHEFGHFAHGGAMRLSYLIRVVTFFMLRIAHERDGFDQALIELSRFRVVLDPRITLVIFLFALFMLGVQAFLWLARGPIKGMAWVGLATCAALLREMEFDADRHEARVSGSDTFGRVGKKLGLLNAAQQTSGALQERWWQGRRLVDDMPGLVVAMAERLAAQPRIPEEIRKAELEQATIRFDTHPALRDRLASVSREAEPGAFTFNAPASALFHNIDELCRAATSDVDEHRLGIVHQGAVVVPVAELLRELEGDREEAVRLARFTHGCPLDACRVAPGPPEVATPETALAPELAARHLDEARRRVQELAPAAIEAARRLAEALDRQVLTSLEVEMIKANSQITGESPPELQKALSERGQAAKELQAAQRDLRPFSEALCHRLQLALKVAPADVDFDLCRAFAAALAGIDAVRDETERLRLRVAVLLGLLQRASGEVNGRFLVRRTHQLSDEVISALKTVKGTLDAVPHPFLAAKSTTSSAPEVRTIGARLGAVQSLNDPPSVFARASDILWQLDALGTRVVLSLASVVEQVESSLGLPPLPDPPQPPSERPTA